jgi:hypothetical protein
MVSVEGDFGITGFSLMLPSIKKQQNILNKKGTCQRFIWQTISAKPNPIEYKYPKLG